MSDDAVKASNGEATSEMTDAGEILGAGTVITNGEAEYKLIEHDELGVVATELGDRELSGENVPEVGDDCIRPQCDGEVVGDGKRRHCNEYCLEWLRTTPKDGDDCKPYSDRCDGTRQVTVNDDGTVEYECDTCSEKGWCARIRWREATMKYSGSDD